MSDEKRGQATRAIHGRPATASRGRPLVAPIVSATTFAFESADELGRTMAGELAGYTYSRLANPTVEDVGRVCADLEGAEDGQAFASGMAAIATALLALLRPGERLLAATQLYGNTYTLIERHLRAHGVEIAYADAADPRAWEQPAHVRYVETIANPGFPVADLAAIARTKGDGLLVVDNTFASPVLCRPLEHGADLVCHSATKYLNGHHDVTAGVVCGSLGLLARVREKLEDLGGILDPFPAYLLRRGLKTLPLRVARQSESALALATFLEAHPAVERVHYAGLPGFPQHELAKRQLDGFGAMMAVEIAGGREGGERFMNGLRLVARATSLGGVETVVHHPASTSHRAYPPERLAEIGVSPGLVRVSVGCEDADDIVADFARALASV
ncbi:MAG: aminotransferase class I/II-fold pyridoxal phosphate-dependent enzyme [Thermoleophilia bacterium]|nr:aminotransferase class I/II-fold pyridoxal phosphate-dependent enzyme [Thermoleophilia bacterium]